MPWNRLRAGLLEDLGFRDADELAASIQYSDIDDARRSLAAEHPSDEFVAALMRAYPTVPTLYFVERVPVG